MADIVKEQVIDPLDFQSSEWNKMSSPHSKIADSIRNKDNPYWIETDVVDDSDMNMYVSGKERYMGLSSLNRREMGWKTANSQRSFSDGNIHSNS
ncbi:hypothetical protein BACCIP111883_04431 [Sutcliffiella rhizosphaerae]|uniref:Uncharacterized protein n=1 Tax=Sutcliffiella rhizosphaerae TaxID=2880967 RepID=A0ABN8AKC1_9BACI|nr:hypothetical protein BACCIP111883_04431 [Sutcliffiella rhizosphaerae]